MSMWVEKNIDNNLFPLSHLLLSGWDLCSNFIITIGNLVMFITKRSEREAEKTWRRTSFWTSDVEEYNKEMILL